VQRTLESVEVGASLEQDESWDLKMRVRGLRNDARNKWRYTLPCGARSLTIEHEQ